MRNYFLILTLHPCKLRLWYFIVTSCSLLIFMPIIFINSLLFMIIIYFTLSVRVIRENKSVTSLKGILRPFYSILLLVCWIPYLVSLLKNSVREKLRKQIFIRRRVIFCAWEISQRVLLTSNQVEKR